MATLGATASTATFPAAAADVGADAAGAAAAAQAAAATDATTKANAAQAASQPLDSDLTAIAALTTTAYGRALLELADAAAGQTAFGLGTAAVMPRPYLPYRSGSTWYYTGAGGVGASLALVQSTEYALPFFVPVTTTFDEIAVMTASGVASSTAQLGIYSDSSGVPGALVLDAGNVATATGGVKGIAISQALTPGWYWLACAVQGAAGNLWCASAGSYREGGLVPTTSPFSAGQNSGYAQTGITGALPSPWGATLTLTLRVPHVWLVPA